MPLQLEQWDDAIGPGLVLADDRRRGDDLSPHEFALRDRQLARRRVERFRAEIRSGANRSRAPESGGSADAEPQTDRLTCRRRQTEWF
jgi:hypothetical protein